MKKPQWLSYIYIYLKIRKKQENWLEKYSLKWNYNYNV